MAYSLRSDEIGSAFVLSLRVERPIEGCEVSALAYLNIKGGAMDNATRAKMLESNPHYFSYRWTRGAPQQMCSNRSCPRRDTYDPVCWSKFALGGPCLQCAICEKFGQRNGAMFCSTSCFRQAWKEHHSTHTDFSFTEPAQGPKSSLDKEGLKGVVDESAFENTHSLSYDEYSNGEEVTIYNDRTYTPVLQDVGCSLRVEVTAHSSMDDSVLAGPVVTFSEPVLSAPKPPPKRPLITVPGSVSFNGVRFRVVSYNVLAEMYATRQIYPSCDSWILSWPYRRNILMHELSEAQGDVVCLQELQFDHYELYLLPFMFSLGYESIFTQKSRDSQGQYGKVDGCATFWKRNKFVMLENYDIEFNEVARRVAVDLGLDDQERRRFLNKLSKDNVAQLVVLDTNQSRAMSRGGPRTALCVVNTHLYANKNQPEVKLWQTLALVNEVEAFIVERDLALVMCGDFNSEPSSSVYEFLSEACIMGARGEVEGSESSVYLPDAGSIVHNLDMASVMSTALKAEPQFTNYTANYKGTLDYIWYTPSRIKVMACTAIPDEKDLLECGEALPNAVYPSDHLMICCDVALSTQGASVLRNPSRKNVTTALVNRKLRR